jgi:ATP-binding cassette subfamily B protein
LTANPLKTKLKSAFRIDRALRFVWQASPGWTVASAALILLQGVLPLLSLYLLKLIIDSTSEALSATGSNDFTTIIRYICLAGGIGLLTALCRFLSDYARKAQSATVTDHMYSVLHRKSVAVDLAYYESPELRDTLHRAQREGPYRPTSIVNGLMLAGQNGAALLGILWLLLLFNPLLTLVMLAASVPGVLMRLRYSNRIYAWQKRRTEDERKAHYFSWMMTDSVHAREIRLFGLGNYFIEQFNNIRTLLRGEKLWFEKRRALGDLTAQASATIAVFGALIYIASETVKGQITLGDMVMYFQAFQRGLTYLGTLLESVAALYEDNLFLSNFYEFLDIEPEVTEPASPLPVPEEIKEGITVEGVTFHYQNCEKRVLDYVNFSIMPGEVVALVGENGAGKSTLVKLLSRLYDPTGGTIRLDGTDIRKHKTSNYREKISIVFQDYIRYFLTVRENIRFGDIESDGKDIRTLEAARKAGIHNIINNMNSGLDTPLGRWYKGGEELSVGQWQMMAMARAFFRNADLVILDEPASALDVNTETRIFEQFKELIENKSALIISHRFSTVKLADKIVLLHDGKIVEQGTHEALIRLGGKYFELYQKQAKQYQ